ncbi:molybdate-binding protein [Glutamicibacter uratoxydans]|uniref:Molybdate-binding protein n=1 Tax=Glutamicibacter uratoxydans TaxID=43667 RepID=A0A4Y4DRT4_GLUUR|nr:molybdate ABC transporter substrate-binding protein [Glutamicibacter uratoxydans]GED06240.1 molybdate-binding protein [Glutamicibacter uratoxydans]
MRIRPSHLVRSCAVVAAAALTLAGCAGTASDTASTGKSQPADTITISAAASLQRSFDEIGKKFQAEHPETKISTISYDGSSTLATQIVEGAKVDVFASADEKNMATVTAAGLGKNPQVFATNTLVIAVPANNPGNVKSLADLSKATTVLCAPKVPCGAASTTLLDNQGVKVTPASQEQNVTAVLQKVAAGEADAGLVYATDVIGEDKVKSIVPEGAGQVVNSYPITALTDNPGAQEFVDFVLSDEGQKILKDHGFGAASSSAHG